jgi:hypothetical protein
MSTLKNLMNIASISSGSRSCSPDELVAESELDQPTTITPPTFNVDSGDLTPSGEAAGSTVRLERPAGATRVGTPAPIAARDAREHPL